jgi:hypothetical protein
MTMPTTMIVKRTGQEPAQPPHPPKPSGNGMSERPPWWTKVSATKAGNPCTAPRSTQTACVSEAPLLRHSGLIFRTHGVVTAWTRPRCCCKENGLTDAAELKVTAESGTMPMQISARNETSRSGRSPAARPAGRNLGEDLLPEPLRDRATPVDTNGLTCTNRKQAGTDPTRTSFGTKRSWVQIPPPRQ